MTLKTAKLGTLSKLFNGRTYKASEWKTSGLPIIRIQNLKNPNKPFNYWGSSFEGQVKVSPGDLLLAWSGTPGTSFGAYIWNGPHGVLNQHIFRIDLEEKRVRKEWAMYAINSQLNILIDGAKGGVGLKHVSKSQVENLDIPLPAIDEQERIIQKLNLAQNLAKKRAESVTATNRYLESVFDEMFGDPVASSSKYPVKTLGELVGEIESGWSPLCESRPAVADEWGVLKLGAISSCKYAEEENKAFLKTDEVDRRIEVRSGDLLFCRKNTYELVAASAYVFSTRPKLMMSDLIFRINPTPSSKVHPLYLWGVLTHPNKRKLIQSLAGGSAGSMPNISKEKLRTVKIPVPPLEAQERYTKIVLNHKVLMKKMQNSAADIVRLSESLLSNYFA